MTFSSIFAFSRVSWQKSIVPFPTDLDEIHIIKIMHLKTKEWVEFTASDIHKFLSFMKNGS